jgi:hypothetical protein
MRAAIFAMLGLTFAIGLAAPTRAQAPSMNDLVIDWATGRYASPVMCEIDGELVRGVRRLILKPRHSLGRPSQLAVHFIDMRPETATRCIDSTAAPQPNVFGKLLLQLPGTPHPETAMRDFKRGLSRDKGFSLDLTEGILKIQDIAVPTPEARLVDFRGGKGSLRLVLPATDADRELSAFKSPKKLVLSLEAPGGERLVLPLFLASEDPV